MYCLLIGSCNYPFVSVLDSCGHFPFSGLLSGRISSFGEFDDCLEFRQTVNSREIRGKYCLTSLSLRIPPKPRNLSFYSSSVDSKTVKDTIWRTVADNAKLFYIARGIRLGLCIPGTCSRDDLQVLFQGQCLCVKKSVSNSS